MLDRSKTSTTNPKFAWGVAFGCVICSLIVVIAYFSGLQINWHTINLDETQTVAPTSETPLKMESDTKQMKFIADKLFKHAKYVYYCITDFKSPLF